MIPKDLFEKKSSSEADYIIHTFLQKMITLVKIRYTLCHLFHFSEESS